MASDKSTNGVNEYGKHPLLATNDDDSEEWELAFERVSKNPDAFEGLSETLRDDKVILLQAINNGGSYWMLLKASDRLQNDRELALAAIQQDADIFEGLSQTLRDDKVILLQAINGGSYNALLWSSDRLQSDRELALAAIQQDAEHFECVSEELRGDREFALEAVKRNGEGLYYVSDRLQSDREVVLAAVRCMGASIQFASAALREDREVVLAAVRCDGASLRFVASEALRGDREVVLAAVTNKGWALRHASEALRADREVVLAAASGNSVGMLEVASEVFRGDRAVVLAAVSGFFGNLKFASAALRRDPQIVLKAVTRSPSVFLYADAALKADPCFVADAIRCQTDDHVGWRDYGSEMKQRLQSVIDTLHYEEERQAGRIVIQSVESVDELVEQIKRPVRHLIWALDQVSQGFDKELPLRLILEYTDITVLFRQANEVKICSPVILAWAEIGVDWRNTIARAQ